VPYVNIKVTDEGVTTEQKAQLIEGVTTLLKEVLGKNPATTILIIEIPTDNWGIEGEQVTSRRKRGLGSHHRASNVHGDVKRRRRT
jgi:4-oxalocrotonate tautomerase